jgi:glycerate 2-kinase
MKKTNPLAILKDLTAAALEAVDPYRLVGCSLKLEKDSLAISPPGRPSFALPIKEKDLWVFALGKAAAPMALACEEILQDHVAGGMVLTKTHHGLPLTRLPVSEGSHPIPDKNSLQATDEMIRLLKDRSKNDLILFFLSGGGSSLLCAPVPGITLKEKQQTSQCLIQSRASIAEINAVRKHLSQVKGGRLARIAYPAQVIVFGLSDVVGDPWDVIASGPFYPDPSSFMDARRILKKYQLWNKIPSTVKTHLSKGVSGLIPETPKRGDPIFKRVEHILMGNNLLALEKAKQRAEALGFPSLILTSRWEGDTHEAARIHGAIIHEVISSHNPLSPPCCLLSGGETTLQVRGKGLGGRNTELALVLAEEISGLDHVWAVCLATDGTDGPTDAAGAWINGNTISKAKKKGLTPEKALKENDSYHFFQAIKQLIKTGPTRSNVMDIRILLIY